jgi:hypothetical protein
MSPQRIVLLPPPEPDGDFDDGGFWDLADLNLVLFNWQQSEANLPQEWINQRPATVGLDSLNLVLFNWQQPAQLLTAVPEPSAIGTLVAGILSLLCWPKRHI